MDSVTDKKSQAERHKRENIKGLKKKIADSEKLVKLMPNKTMKQMQARDAEKNKMNSYLMNQASMMKTIPYNWYIMKAYAEAGLPYISDVAKEYVEKHDENDQPIDKTKKAVKTTEKKKARTGEPSLLKSMESKKKNFGSAEAKLKYYYEKLRKEELEKAKKKYPNNPDAVKSEMDYVEDAWGPEGRGWSKMVKKLETAETKIKKLRKIYIALWKMGFDEKMLLHQFRIYEMEDHPRGRSKSQIWLGDSRIPSNKIINEISEILQEIREDWNLDKLIESIEVLNEGKITEKIFADPKIKEAFIKLRTTLAKTIYEIFQIYNKTLWKYDGAVVDWLGRPDDKIWRINKTPVKSTSRLFDDYIFDKSTPF